jgi:opacity protein-like surface antigen
MHRFFFYFTPIILCGISLGHGQERKEPPSRLFFDSEIIAPSIQDQSQNEYSESSKSSIYLQFNISGLYSWLTDRKNQNLQTNGTSPSTKSIIFGGECGYIMNKYVQIGFGYEYFFTTKVATQSATGDQINSTFFYGSLKAEMPLESVTNLSLFIGLDIGSVTATEVLENYGGLDFNRAGSSTGYRVMLGAQYFLIDNWSIMAGGGYILGKVNNVIVDGRIWPNYSLDLSGFTIKFAVNYHFPL